MLAEEGSHFSHPCQDLAVDTDDRVAPPPLRQVQKCLDDYAFVYIFSVQNMRNAKLKEVRTHWRRSRFFFGKNKVMARALGRSDAEEYKPGLAKVAEVSFYSADVGSFALCWF